jgi:hypothetical protein
MPQGHPCTDDGVKRARAAPNLIQHQSPDIPRER